MTSVDVAARITSEKLSLTEIDSPIVRAVLDHWTAAKGERSMPRRADMKPEEMRRGLGHIMIFERDAGGKGFRYRLFGSGIAAAQGRDFTRRLVRELEPPNYAALIERHYEECFATKSLSYYRIAVSLRGRSMEYTRLLLPLSSDGIEVDMVIAVSDSEKDFWNFFIDI